MSAKIKLNSSVLKALITSASFLHGLLPADTHAAEDNGVDFQYSHYQEGRREVQPTYTTKGLLGHFANATDLRAPIEVDSLHGSGRFTLTDRIKFAFNYTQDTWAGATPYGSAPDKSTVISFDSSKNPIFVGASPFASKREDVVFDKQGNPVYGQILADGTSSFLKTGKPVHVMGYASPETRKQGDFKLDYEWDEAALQIGGGISLERDYESRFVNLGSRFDFNQKRTTVDLALSYTNSLIDATLDPLTSGFVKLGQSLRPNYIGDLDDPTRGQHLRGTRQDWASHIGLSQIISADTVATIGMTYIRSTGFMENPYKLSWFFAPDPEQQHVLPQELGLIKGAAQAYVEQRPDERNLLTWSTGWTQYVPPLDAALHFNYQFAHDDWGINAHTFESDWVQPLPWGWTLTPRIRYYSQSAADFYQPYFRAPVMDIGVGTFRDAPINNFTSDQRLSGFGTLSGGLTVAKQFAKGVGVEAGVEYYTHQGGLKLGGGGEGDFADFDYWVANAALKVNLAAIGQGLHHDSHGEHGHHSHPNLPAGVLFGHTLDKAGDWMVGYRYQRNWRDGGYLRGDKEVTDREVLLNGCPGSIANTATGETSGACSALARGMTMSMHMLDLMYAPTDWLTLMLMPQWMDMEMPLVSPDKEFQPAMPSGINTHNHGGGHLHGTGGISDLGMYALIKLFDQPGHQLHTSLGLTAPTGDSNIKLKEFSRNQDGGFLHYCMQLGSGTWDFNPSLTYNGADGDWWWGAQVGGTKRLESSNKSGFAFGDIFESSLWAGYNLTPWLAASVRGVYNWQGSVRGGYPRGRNDEIIKNYFCQRYDGQPPGEYDACIASIDPAEYVRADAVDRQTPLDAPGNYGGQYVNLGLGLSVNIPHGAFAGNNLSFEWLQPVYTNVNGYQLDRDGALSFTWSVGF